MRGTRTMTLRRYLPVLLLLRFSQEECDQVTRWDLLALKQGTVGTPTVAATVPATAVTCTTDPTTIYAPPALPSTLKRGKWTVTLRAVAGDGEVADSLPLDITIPLPKPTLLSLTKP